MRRKIFISIAILALVWIGYRAYRIATTRSHSPTETITFNNNGLEISITYGRPYKKGRQIFGEAKDRVWLPKGQFWTDAFRVLTGLPRTKGALVPNGIYWRLGANDAEISFSKNIQFAGKPVKEGRYRMYAVPNRGRWEVILNSELGKFGYHEPNHSFDIVRVDVPVETNPSETEQFTINFAQDFSGVMMQFIWDKTLIRVPIALQ